MKVLGIQAARGRRGVAMEANKAGRFNEAELQMRCANDPIAARALRLWGVDGGAGRGSQPAKLVDPVISLQRWCGTRPLQHVPLHQLKHCSDAGEGSRCGDRYNQQAAEAPRYLLKLERPPCSLLVANCSPARRNRTTKSTNRKKWPSGKIEIGQNPAWRRETKHL